MCSAQSRDKDKMIVACVWVQANVPFHADYVTRLRSMTRRSCPEPHRFVCLTDRPEALPADMETIKIARRGNEMGWWSKLELFNPAHLDTFGRDGILYLDLDVLIVGALDLAWAGS